MKKNIAICIPCYNEIDNIEELYLRICSAIKPCRDYNFSIIFADNSSTDGTKEFIEKISNHDDRIGYINNVSNFGFVRSSANVLIAPDADANIFLLADLQDPPELIPKLIKKWEEGEDHVIFATRKSSKESKILFIFKKIYYSLLSKLSDYKMVRDTTGFGIYDKIVILNLRKVVDSYPFIKGLVCAIGFKWSTIPYVSSERRKGKSKASLSLLVDFGVLGIVTLSRKPMRIINILGFSLGSFSLILSMIVVLTKLLLWNSFAFGLAMLSTSMLFLSGIILFSIGVIGEYIGFINQRSLRLPLVVEGKRINVPKND